MSRIDKCCIRNCSGISKSRFSIPKNAHEKWEKAVGITLGKRLRVCGDHFSKENIIDTWVSGQRTSAYSVKHILQY